MTTAIVNEIVNGINDSFVIRGANVMNMVIYTIGDSFNALIFSGSPPIFP